MTIYFTNRKARKMAGIMLPVEQWWNPGGTLVDPDCVACAWIAKGADSFDASLIDVAGAGGAHNLTVGDAPAWDASYGWRFSTPRQNYLISDVVPEDHYSYVFRFAGLDTSTLNSIFGEYSATGVSDIDFFPSVAAKGMIWYWGDSIEDFPPVVTEGVFGLAGDQAYRGGAADNSVMAYAGWTEAANALYIGAVNANGTPNWYVTADIYAMAIYTCTLTATQMMIISHALMGL